MQRLFFSLSVLILLCGCADEPEIVIPPYVLDKEQYAKLMTDYSLAEAAGNVNPKLLGGAKFDSAYAFRPLEENNITQAQYDSSASFYSRHPELYKEICEMVLTKLSTMKAAREAAVADSTRKHP